MSESVVIVIGLSILGLIAWFARQMHADFKELKGDVKQLLINGSARDEDLKSMEADIHTLVMKHDGVDKRLQRVEQDIEVIKIKVK